MYSVSEVVDYVRDYVNLLTDAFTIHALMGNRFKKLFKFKYILSGFESAYILS
jgi:hypothetical protein